jgi:hypothetical protein
MSTLQAISLAEKIRQRGYWQVIIRPTRFEQDRIRDVHELLSLVEKHSVRMRGWDYPHIDRRSPPSFGNDWVGQESEWEHFLEVWRFYQSGQFFDILGFDQDWRDHSSLWPPEEGWKPGTILYYRGTLFQFTEIFEFAARLAQSVGGDENMHLEVKAVHLAGRKILFDASSGEMLTDGSGSTISDHTFIRDLPRIHLMSQARKLAVEATAELLGRLGLRLSPRIISSLQEGILRQS